MMTEHSLNQVGATVWEMLRTWDSMNNEGDKPGWKKLDAATKEAVIDRVKAVQTDPRSGDATFHMKWLLEQQKAGWTDGKVFDEARKIDPLMKPFNRLPTHIQNRERAFRALVISLSYV